MVLASPNDQQYPRYPLVLKGVRALRGYFAPPPPPPPPYEAKKMKIAFHKFLLISLLEQ